MAKIKGVKFETMTNTYTVVNKLGEGGAGFVYQVTNQEGQTLALKQLSPNVVSTDKVKRFRNEMVFLSKNPHPNLVQVFDTGFVTADNKKIPFYVMPLCGQTLRHLITKQIRQDKILPYFSNILDGVEALHLKGVWHRDLKPENILYDEQSDKLLIADLRIAHFEEENLHTNIITKAGSRLANFEYAAPEQRRKGGIVNGKADIYALGLILNEMFTGDVLQGTGHKTIATVNPNYSYLDNLIDLMVRQSSDDRPNSIDAIKQELIGMRNDFIQRQKISELENTVIPTTEFEDILIADPVKIVGVDYRNGNLIFELNHNVNNEWVYNFKNMQAGYTYTMHCQPSYFDFHDNTASIRAYENDAPRTANFFKEYLALANQQYETVKTREHREKEQRERQTLQANIQRQKKELEIRQAVLSRINL